MLCNSSSRTLSQTHIRMILRQTKGAISWTDAWSSPDGTYWNSQGRVQGCVSVNDNSVLLSRLLTNFLDSHIFPPVFAMQTRPTGLYPHTHYKPVPRTPVRAKQRHRKLHTPRFSLGRILGSTEEQDRNLKQRFPSRIWFRSQLQ